MKAIKGLTFYGIVAVEHLLGRLGEDRSRPAVCQSMTKLLLNSFLPSNTTSNTTVSSGSGGGGGKSKGNEVGKALESGLSNTTEEAFTLLLRQDVNTVEQCRRCVEFATKNIEAAMGFYSCIHMNISLTSTAQFVLALFQLISYHAQVAAEGNKGHSSDHSSTVGAKEKGSKKKGDLKRSHAQTHSSSSEEASGDTPSSLLSESPELYLHLIQIITIILSSIQKKLTQPSHAAIRTALVKMLSRGHIGTLLPQITAAIGHNSDPSMIETSSEITCALLKIVTLLESIDASSASTTATSTSGRRKSLSTLPAVVRDSLTCATLAHKYDHLAITLRSGEGQTGTSPARVLDLQARTIVEAAAAFREEVCTTPIVYAAALYSTYAISTILYLIHYNIHLT